jgi:RsiW-degrading membrane proteinase PrsW (M82 family)
MLIYPIFLYWLDRYEKEPLPLIISAFMWGFVPAAIFSLISQFLLDVPLYLLDVHPGAADLFATVVTAPITEEIFKGVAILIIYFVWRRQFDGVMDGIIYGGLVGFGFAAIENVLYFLEPDAAVVVMRAVIFGLNHAFFTSLTGIGFGVARHSRNGFLRFLAPLVGLAAAMTAHAIHNLTVSMVQDFPALLCITFISDWGGVLFVFGVILFALRRERQWIVTQLLDEVSASTLNEKQYQITSSAIRRFGVLLNALFTSGPTRWWRVGRYFEVLTELAYKKHAYSRRGEGGASQSLISQLRTQASALSVELSDLR